MLARVTSPPAVGNTIFEATVPPSVTVFMRHIGELCPAPTDATIGRASRAPAHLTLRSRGDPRMPLSEYPLETLRSYRPDPNAPSDLAQFWTSTLAESSRTPLNATVEKVDYPVDGLDVRRVTYDGWRGARIVGWFIARQGARAQPTLVFYHGYSGSKGQV